MKLFISWSGERSKLVATALRDLLPEAIQDLIPWMSDHDINAGARWGHDLTKQLAECDLGIICLTPENLLAPWLLFEAGALAKSVIDSRVVPYRLGLTATDVSLPLAQFQGVDANEAGTRKLFQSLNSVRSDPMPDERVERIFSRWWPDLSAQIGAIPAANEPKVPPKSEHEMLEEVLSTTRLIARQNASLQVVKLAVESPLRSYTSKTVPNPAYHRGEFVLVVNHDQPGLESLCFSDGKAWNAVRSVALQE